jgi:acetylornithine deacetylase/succinyl-diaminopimelate desuccinylase-like protein
VLEVEFRSEGGHGARPSKGHSAIEDAAEFIRRLKELRLKKHDVLGKGSACVLKIQGGGDSLSVPSSCIVRIDRHGVPGDSKSSIKDDLRSLLNKLGMGKRADIRWMRRPTPFLRSYVTKQTPIVDLLVEEHRKFFRAGTGYGRSVGDYNLFALRMSTAVLGPKGANWHTKQEYVEVVSIDRCHRFYRRFLDGLDKLDKKDI